MKRLAIATNNGDIGGGEVMLFHTARALRDLGFEVEVVTMREPDAVARHARELGFATTVLPASGRVQYMLQLALWRLRHPRIALWCNGLVPSTATAGLGPRITQIHLLPTGLNRIAAQIARLGSPRAIVPSQFMRTHLPYASVVENWTHEVGDASRPREDQRPRGPLRVGFLGRLTRDKGILVLVHAIQQLHAKGRDIELVIGGENRFGADHDNEVIDAAIQQLGSRVTFLGWVERQEFFSRVDVAVFPSIAHESFGLVVAEAMSARVPFVIARSGALPEVAGPGYPWIAERDDADSLARVLEDLMHSPAQEIDTWVMRSRKRWEHVFSPRAGQARIYDFLTQRSN